MANYAMDESKSLIIKNYNKQTFNALLCQSYILPSNNSKLLETITL